MIHEAVHALVDRVARLPFQGEGGSINEAYADFLAASYLDNPLMGEVSFKGGPYRRNLEERRSWQTLNGGLYNDSQVISSLFWAIRQNIGVQASLELAIATLRELFPDDDLASFRQLLFQQAQKVLSKDQYGAFLNLASEHGWPLELAFP